MIRPSYVQGGFEFKCESAFFYEFCVTKVKILFDIRKLEAILHILCLERMKIDYSFHYFFAFQNAYLPEPFQLSNSMCIGWDRIRFNICKA